MKTVEDLALPWVLNHLLFQIIAEHEEMGRDQQLIAGLALKSTKHCSQLKDSWLLHCKI